MFTFCFHPCNGRAIAVLSPRTNKAAVSGQGALLSLLSNMAQGDGHFFFPLDSLP